ncbi:MAG: hypothetical protein A3E78_11900 [Alphaproteobacteria bacterium RIFCSPHIGHO2_12_FULL_63_12]|nr:MAG: hypothetical protein A3E78_11900 [Alphaproteobacteria bacterium RIFCSPHIGHO2_12_FULL_63_12]
MKPQVSQLGLFGGHPMARATDHDSSHAAADKLEASGKAQVQRNLVLSLVQRWPGMSSGQLARLGAVDRYVVARRLPELRSEGKVSAVKPAGKEITWFPT